MIADRGAVAAALERWNARRRQIFYPKTEFDFGFKELSERKKELQKLRRDSVARILDEEIRNLEFLPGAGTLHALFRVETASQRFILKLGVEDADFGFAIENWVMQRIEPRLIISAFEATANSLPCPFLIIEEAPGRMLSTFEDPETQAMPEPLLFELGRTFARVHEIHGVGGGLLDCAAEDWPKGLHPTWPDYLLLRLDEHLRGCLEVGAINQSEHTQISSHFAESDYIFRTAPICLLHSDLGHHNVFSDGQRITAIIDWEDALCGDPVFDIAYWGTFVRDEMRQRFVEGYQTIQKLPPDFERRYWLYYLRVALSKTIHRVVFATKDRPGRPPASQRIQKALSNLAKL